MIDLAGATYGCSLMIESTARTADVRGRGTRLAGVVALLVLAALLALAWALQRPPAPAAASAPATTFSAERAYVDLQRMAGPEPTPIGSVAGDAVRDYLVSTLSAAGLSVEVQKGLGSRTFGGVTAAGLVDNVVATCLVTPRPGGSCWLPTTTPPSALRGPQTTSLPLRRCWRRPEPSAANRHAMTSS